MLWVVVSYLGHMISMLIGNTPSSNAGRLYAWINLKVENAVDKMHEYSTTIKVQRTKRKHRVRGRPRRKGRRLTCHAVMVFSAAAKSASITTFDTDSGEVGIDNRASGCFSHMINDFVGPMRDCNKVVKGFGGSRTSNVKMGTLKWSWDDDRGIKTTHLIPNSYYSKAGGVRLLSPQHFAQESQKEDPSAGSRTTARDVVLTWGNGSIKTVPLDRKSNVATFHLSPGYDRFNTFCVQAHIETDQDDNPIQTQWQNEQLDHRDAYHTETPIRSWPVTGMNRFNLEGERRIADAYGNGDDRKRSSESELLQIHYNMGHIHPDRLKLMAKQGVIHPKFQYVKMPFCAACAYGKATRNPWRSRSTNNKDEAERPRSPGEVVSVDQMISPTPGLVAQMTGILTTKRYTCATVYVDQFSGYSFIWIQKSTGVDETLEGKRAFEEHARSSGVKVQHYHADNGVFKARAWVDDCHQKHQRTTYAGVGAHHQNGMAERRIRVLQDLTRAQMAHSSRRWPEAMAANLWPYAIRIANEEWNHAPNPRERSGRSPAQLFHNTETQRNAKHSIPFGCPVFVLKDQLQQRAPFHKWKDRARLGMYLGRSPMHARSVSLVMDLEKGYVSPQFHCNHDKAFATVRNSREAEHGRWKIRAGFVRRRETARGSKDGSQNLPEVKEGADVIPETLRPVGIEGPGPEVPEKRTSEGGENDQGIEVQSSRVDDSNIPNQEAIESELFAFTTQNEPYPQDAWAMKAQVDPDTMYYHQAMREEDSDEFIEAMNKEIRDQCSNGNFEVVSKKELPKGTRPLPAVWQMRRKRDIRTGKIKKYKARLNLDGSKMIKGVDYNRTYAPVATWNAIRILLVMVLTNKWHTIQIDYVSAFPQAPIEKVLYMNIPAGVTIKGKDPKQYVLKCNKNIYGQRQAGRVWNQFLIKKLKRIGFRQSSIDSCVLYRGKTIYVLYTDDSIIAGPCKVELDKTITEIRQVGLDITVEGSLEDFLGIRMDRKDNGTIHMYQPQLIKQIMDDMKVDISNLNPKPTPMVSSRILKRHNSSDPHDESFHYRSIIGKLNYLEKGSRPDLSYSVHQCARFASQPKVEHSKAIRRIIRYLAGSADKGTIFKPDKSRGLQVHVDADFAGNWDPIDTRNVDTARSRHGYVITLAGCPICWKSQLQTEIALSSTESEYTGLSYALREVIPIMNLLREMESNGYPVLGESPIVKCTVFEDNSGALEMAKEHKFRPRTKHINNKLHHFRWYVEKGDIILQKIASADQPADLLTKPLAEDLFRQHRQTIMGW